MHCWVFGFRRKSETYCSLGGIMTHCVLCNSRKKGLGLKGLDSLQIWWGPLYDDTIAAPRSAVVLTLFLLWCLGSFFECFVALFSSRLCHQMIFTRRWAFSVQSGPPCGREVCTRIGFPHMLAWGTFRGHWWVYLYHQVLDPSPIHISFSLYIQYDSKVLVIEPSLGRIGFMCNLTIWTSTLEFYYCAEHLRNSGKSASTILILLWKNLFIWTYSLFTFTL